MNIDYDFDQDAEAEKMDIDQIYKACLIARSITNKLEPLFDLYYDHIIDPKGENKRWYSSEFRHADESGFWIAYSYNDSCSCHPETRESEFLIPWDFIEQFHKDPNGTKASLLEKKKAKEAELLAKKQEEERKQKLAKEAAERKQFEELKKKFGE